jgi:hypothetical protein
MGREKFLKVTAKVKECGFGYFCMTEPIMLDGDVHFRDPRQDGLCFCGVEAKGTEKSFGDFIPSFDSIFPSDDDVCNECIDAVGEWLNEDI